VDSIWECKWRGWMQYIESSLKICHYHCRVELWYPESPVILSNAMVVLPKMASKVHWELRQVNNPLEPDATGFKVMPKKNIRDFAKSSMTVKNIRAFADTLGRWLSGIFELYQRGHCHFCGIHLDRRSTNQFPNFQGIHRLTLGLSWFRRNGHLSIYWRKPVAFWKNANFLDGKR